MRRKGVLVGIVVLAVCCGLLVLRPRDPLGAALGRIRPGMDEAATVAAVGNAAGGAIAQSGPGGEPAGRLLYWRYGDDVLMVEFDGDGKAVQILAQRPDVPLWERVRAWWPW
jgi:hypothetical protein